jgi:hypothetical protein
MINVKTFGTQILALLYTPILVACSSSGEESGRERRMSSSSAIDSLRAALPEVTLGQNDSVFVSEPSALAVTNSSIFVADAGTSTILVYDRAGTFRNRVGRRGKGPGEFQAPAVMATTETGLVVVDAALQRLTLVDEQGAKPHAQVIPAQAMSVGSGPTGLLLGAQDVPSKSSVLLVNLADSSMRRFGPLPLDLVKNPQIASSYPFSIVTYAAGHVLVGFTGSSWLYRIRLDGTVVDSTQTVARLRRGVPNDLGERLRKSRSPESEAMSTSMLIMLAPLSRNRIGTVHMDFVVDGPAVSGKAYFSALDNSLRPLCTDVVIPLLSDTRPMFSFRSDTLLVVQNRLSGEAAVSTLVTSFDTSTANCAS